MFASLVSGLRYQLIRKKKNQQKKTNKCVNGANMCENKVVKVKIVVAVVDSVGGWKNLQVWEDTLTKWPTARAPHIFTHSKQSAALPESQK